MISKTEIHWGVVVGTGDKKRMDRNQIIKEIKKEGMNERVSLRMSCWMELKRHWKRSKSKSFKSQWQSFKMCMNITEARVLYRKKACSGIVNEIGTD